MARKPKTDELDPGPVQWGGVEFVHVRHETTGGEADVPAHLVDHHRARGWEPVDPDGPSDGDSKTEPTRRTTPKTEGKG